MGHIKKYLSYLISHKRAVVFVALFALIGTYLILKSSAATPNLANIWIDTNGGTCTASATPIAYNDSTACSSAASAYAKSAAGYTVMYRAGSYVDQEIDTPTQVSGTTAVLFQAEPGSSVTLGGLGMNKVNYVEFDDFTSGGWSITTAQNITMRNIKTSCSGCSTNGFLGKAQHIKLYNLDMGPIDPGDGIEFYPLTNSAIGAGNHNDDILIDGLFMHDLTRNNDPAAHDDCIDINDGTNITFRRLKLYNCGTQGLYTTTSGIAPDQTISNVTIENSWFGPAQLGTNAISLRGGSNITVRNNTITDTPYLQDVSSVHWVGNIFAGFTWPGADCSYLPDSGHGTVEYKYNVSTVGCGGDVTNKTDATIRSKLVNPDPSSSAGYDAHFKATSGTASAVNILGFNLGTGCALDDYDGNARPAGASCDAGAQEFGASGASPSDTTNPTVSLTAPANSATVSGNVTVSATASDNIGVVGVQFKLDGANLGSEVTASPYTFTWASNSSANGAHTITAVARDAAGNSTTSSSRTVTVTAASSGKVGDFNNDGLVNIFDLSLFLTKYGSPGSGLVQDMNNDGLVNIFDLSIFLSKYGT